MSRFSVFGQTSTLASCAGLCALILTGEIVQGVTCPALMTEDGTVVALSHLPSQFQIGDRVQVTGSGYAGSATCQQEVLIVTAAEAAS